MRVFYLRFTFSCVHFVLFWFWLLRRTFYTMYCVSVSISFESKAPSHQFISLYISLSLYNRTLWQVYFKDSIRFLLKEKQQKYWFCFVHSMRYIFTILLNWNIKEVKFIFKTELIFPIKNISLFSKYKNMKFIFKSKLIFII